MNHVKHSNLLILEIFEDSCSIPASSPLPSLHLFQLNESLLFFMVQPGCSPLVGLQSVGSQFKVPRMEDTFPGVPGNEFGPPFVMRSVLPLVEGKDRACCSASSYQRFPAMLCQSTGLHMYPSSRAVMG